MIPTTSIGTWCNFGDHYSSSVESTVADYMNGGPNDWRKRMDESGATERIVADYRTAIDAVLPEGIALCGNEFIADVDVEFDADEMTEAIEAIDLGAIIERHDIDRDA